MSAMPWEKYAAMQAAPAQAAPDAASQMPWEKYAAMAKTQPSANAGEAAPAAATAPGTDLASEAQRAIDALTKIEPANARPGVLGHVVTALGNLGGGVMAPLALAAHPVQAMKAAANTASEGLGALVGAPKIFSDAPDLVQPVVSGLRTNPSGTLENLAGALVGGTALAGLEPSAGLGAAGEAPAVGAEGPVNAVSVANRMVGGAGQFMPEAVRNGSLPSAWDWATPSPLGKMIAQPRGTVAAEAASPLELKAYADAHGIPLNAAQATQHNLPLNLQNAGERATIGGTGVKQQILAGQAAVLQHAQSLMDQLSPDTPDVGTAGAKLQQDIGKALAAQKDALQQGYKNIDNVGNGVMVNLQPLKAEATELLNDNDFIRHNLPSTNPKRATNILTEITQMPDHVTFTAAGKVRSNLLDEARHPDNVINQEAQGWMTHLAGIGDRQMNAAAESSANPALVDLWRQTNARWKALQEDFNSPRSPLYQALQEPDPNKVPQKFTAQGQIGGSPYNAELLDRYQIDKAPVKWALMGDMMKKDFGLYNGGKTLAGYSDPFLQSMFAPGELDSIYKTGAIARSLKANANPSGTAAVTGAMNEITHPWQIPLKSGAAMLTNSPRFNDWLLRNPGGASARVGPTPPPSAVLPAMGGAAASAPASAAGELLQRSQDAFHAARLAPGPAEAGAQGALLPVRWGSPGREFPASLGGPPLQVGDIVGENQDGVALKVVGVEGKTASGEQRYRFRTVDANQARQAGERILPNAPGR